MTVTTYNYPPGTTPEAIEAFRTMFGQTPEDDIRLGTTFETFLKGYASGRMFTYLQLSHLLDSVEGLNDRVEDLERFKEANVAYDSYGNYTRLVG
jgi:hypothetical protein